MFSIIKLLSIITKNMGIKEDLFITHNEIGLKNIPEFDLEKGIDKLSDMIRDKKDQLPGTIVAEIAGGSASGKTSAVASKIKDIFNEEAIIFSMDDYYKGVKFMNEQKAIGNELNWDQPEAVDIELFKTHLEQLKNGQAVKKPIYNMQTGSREEKTETINPTKIIIVEGLFALNDAIKNQGDVKAFVDIGTHGRTLRRLLRDIERTGQKPMDILKYFSEVVEPMNKEHVDTTKANADIVIKNEYSPQTEAERSGLHEVQTKYPLTEVNYEQLRKLGAEKLSTTNQIDNYYNPKDRNLIETGEILRIRDEGRAKTLTYKGPKKDSEYRERPKFEFEIDQDTENKFLKIYGSKVKIIKKQRTLYQLDGTIFSIDKVTKEEDGQDIDIGTFLEIRSTDKSGGSDKFNSLKEKLNLQGVPDNRSYFEM